MDFRIETQLRQEISDAWKLVDQYKRAAIEAAVLPEGWVAVPKEPTLAMLDCLRSDITSNLEKRYQAMLAAAPKAQAEKQEPVKDEPVTCIVSSNFCECDKRPLYTRPQPDLTAEVERLRNLSACEACIEIPSVGEYVAQCENRIAALEEAAQQARDTLQYKQYKLNIVAAISKLDRVLNK